MIGLTDRLSPNPKHRGLYGHSEAAARPAEAPPLRMAASL